jgi:hypothetical protein
MVHCRLGNSGYFLPNTEENRERFEWLATAVRTEGGEASVLGVQSIDNCSFAQMKQQFSDARAGEYRELLRTFEIQLPPDNHRGSRVSGSDSKTSSPSTSSAAPFANRSSRH